MIFSNKRVQGFSKLCSFQEIAATVFNAKNKKMVTIK